MDRVHEAERVGAVLPAQPFADIDLVEAHEDAATLVELLPGMLKTWRRLIFAKLSFWRRVLLGYFFR